MEAINVLFEDPIVRTLVAVLGYLSLCWLAGYYQSVTALASLMGKYNLSRLAHRLMGLSRSLIFIVGSVYIGAFVLPKYPHDLARNIGLILQNELGSCMWVTLLFVGLLHAGFRGHFRTQVTLVRSPFVFQAFRDGFLFDGMPWLLKRLPWTLKFSLIAVFALGVIPFALYLSVSLPSSFARWHGFVDLKNHRKS